MDVKLIVKSFVEAHVRGHIDRQALLGNSPLFSSGIIDSFAVLELLTFLEDTFEIELDPSQYQLKHFDTLDKISVLVMRLQRRQTDT